MLLERDSGYGARPGLHRPLCLHTESPESPYSRSLPSSTLDGNFATQVRRDWRENYLRGARDCTASSKLGRVAGPHPKPILTARAALAAMLCSPGMGHLAVL